MGFVGRLLQDVSWASGKLLGWGTKRTCLYVSYLPPNARTVPRFEGRAVSGFPKLRISIGNQHMMAALVS